MLTKYVKFVALINAAFYLTTSPVWLFLLLTAIAK